MGYEKKGLETLSEYMPQAAIASVIHYIKQHKIQFKITNERKTVHGTYQNKSSSVGHVITVNGNLNPYAFLVTFMHELAHLHTVEANANRFVAPHGPEWKTNFGRLIVEFISLKVFPEDIETALYRSLHSPGASTCGDLHLSRVLGRYDKEKPGYTKVENVQPGSYFKTSDGRIFKKGALRRTRFLCKELNTNKTYLFPALFEVRLVSQYLV